MGTFSDDKVMLVDGQSFVFDMNEEPGDMYRVRLPHPEILNTLRVGDSLLLGKGVGACRKIFKGRGRCKGRGKRERGIVWRLEVTKRN